jgi:hypothetical protein
MSPGDTIIGHSPDVAQAYRQAAQEAARRQASGLPPAGSAVQITSTAPAGQPLPMIGVAAQVRNRELGRLEAERDRLERDITRSAFTLSGQPAASDPGLALMRQDQQRGLDMLRDQIEQLRGLEGDALRAWAASQGYQ